jgi:peptidoglycan/LPS O-acetylase OafA/YrhL
LSDTLKAAQDGLASPRSGWRADIQGLRGLAVLLVVLFHADLPVPGGFVGVDVFFVISGFVITANIARRLRLGGFSFREFYWNRFRRLVPALSVLVLCALIASLFLQSPIDEQVSTSAMALGAMLSFANVVAYLAPDGYFHQGLAPNPLLNTWSLSVEEQFYFGLTLLLLLIIFLARKVRRWQPVPLLVIVIVIVSAISLLLNIASSYRTPGTLLFIPSFINTDFAFFSPFTRAWEFGIGALIALSSWKTRGRVAVVTLRLFGVILIAVTAFWLNPDVTFPGLVVAIPVIGSALIIIAGSVSQDGSKSLLLANRPMVKLGDASYSWYLWHWPVIVFAIALFGSSLRVSVAAALFSLVPALLSLRFIENPLRQMEMAGANRNLRRIGIWFIPPLAFGAALLILSSNLWFNPGLKSFAEQTDPHGGTDGGCTIQLADFGIGSQVCTWPSGSKARPVYLVGDSTAAHFGSDLRELTEEQGRPLTLAWHPGCPYYGVNMYWREGSSTVLDPTCAKFNQEMTRILVDAPPGLVILSSSSVPFYSSAIATSLGAEPPSADPLAKAADVSIGVENLVLELQARGHDVAIIQSAPAYFTRSGDFVPLDQWRPQKCILFRWMNSSTHCGATRSLSELDLYQGPVRIALESVSKKLEIPLMDPRLTLCSDGSCSTNEGGVWDVSDGTHINLNGAAKVKPQFAALLR